MRPPHTTTVGDVSEAQLLAAILGELRGSSAATIGPGDDAAVLAVPGGSVVVSTDTLVHGPDFRLAWSSGFDLGAKSAAVNLADIAAMGARPTALLVALALPPQTEVSFVQQLAEGLRSACDALAPGCAVEGGDLTVSDTLTIAVTALGVLDGRAPVPRSGARVGDVVAICGRLGDAARGLQILFDRFRDAEGTPVTVDDSLLDARERELVSAQLRPQPPIAQGPVAAEAGAVALMDVSDGLVLDAGRMADASGVTLELRGRFADHELHGGEDHALLAVFPPTASVPPGFRVIGSVTSRGPDPVTVDGVPPHGRGGWDPQRDWDAGRG